MVPISLLLPLAAPDAPLSSRSPLSASNRLFCSSDRPFTDEIVGRANSFNLSPAAPVRAAKHVTAPLAPAAPAYPFAASS